MYLTIMIVLVETQCLMTDICEISLPNASRLTGPVASDLKLVLQLWDPFCLRWTVMIDNEAESLPSHALQSQGVQECGLEKVIL